MSLIVYFSSRSENTHRFVQRLGLPAVRIPLNEREHLRVDEPYILIVPSYGGGGTAGAVPRQAIRFLNDVQIAARRTGTDCRRTANRRNPRNKRSAFPLGRHESRHYL